jgi:ribonuclease-3
LLKDPKTRLQETLQARRHTLPEYGVLEVAGTQHQQEFEVYCRVAGLELETRGTGSSRRRAEQQAARQMLAALSGQAT